MVDAQVKNMIQNLRNLRPMIEEICSVSGSAGVSVGILHHGKPVFTDNFGFRDVEARIPPDENTIYYLASLSKSFTAAAIALLVKQGKLDWDLPVSQVYPPLQHRDDEIRNKANIVDFMSHRTGLAPKNHLWSQEYGHLSLRRGETIRTVAYLEKVAPFRKRWIYSNWGYGVADTLIEHLSGESWGTFLKKNIFEPLNMDRTVTERKPPIANVAKAYMALKNGKPYLLPEPDGEDGDIIEGALGVKSCIHDLLRYYQAFLTATNSEFPSNLDGTRPSPFVDAEIMLKPHIRLSTESPELDGSYGLGWVSARLPCTLGAIGLNHGFVNKMPTVGRGLARRRTCIYHQGSANTFLSSVYLLPDSGSGVVILTNSLAKNDAADWLGELYLECLLQNSDRNDYVQIAKTSAATAMKLWPAMVEELAAAQIPNTPCRPLQVFVGTYYNVIGNYHIEIFLDGDELAMRFQREKIIAYKLKHYHYDTFSWILTHDQDVRVGRFPITRASFYLIRFEPSPEDASRIDRLVWAHDDEVLEGEVFFDREGMAKDCIEEIHDEAVPYTNTRFQGYEDGAKDAAVPFPDGEGTFRRRGLSRSGVLMATKAEEKTADVQHPQHLD
jgi:CubicO group peptidase (beta-lactamase class C family)